MGEKISAWETYKRIGNEFTFIIGNGARRKEPIALYAMYDDEILFLIERYTAMIIRPNNQGISSNHEELVSILKDELRKRRIEKIYKIKNRL